MDLGRHLCEQALEVDPQYAAPLVDLAHYYCVSTMTQRITSTEGTAKGLGAAERALTLDSTLGEAIGFRARFRALAEYRWAEALADFSQALEMNPASSLTAQGHAVVLTALNRLPEAIRQQDHALKADPFSSLNHYVMARLFVHDREYERAETHANLAIELAPSSWLANATLGLVQLRTGRIADAIRSLDTAHRTAPVGFIASGWRGCAYVLAGEIPRAEQILAELDALGSPVPAAMIYTQLGNTEAAFDRLRTAVRGQDFQLYGLQVDSAFDRLRSERQYSDLLGLMNLQS